MPNKIEKSKQDKQPTFLSKPLPKQTIIQKGYDDYSRQADTILNEHEAAKAVGKSVQTLRNDRHLRRGCPYVKLGRSVRYLLSDIQNYLQKHRIDPEAS